MMRDRRVPSRAKAIRTCVARTAARAKSPECQTTAMLAGAPRNATAASHPALHNRKAMREFAQGIRREFRGSLRYINTEELVTRRREETPDFGRCAGELRVFHQEPRHVVREHTPPGSRVEGAMQPEQRRGVILRLAWIGLPQSTLRPRERRTRASSE